MKAVIKYDESGVLVLQRLQVHATPVPLATPDGMAQLHALLQNDRSSVVFAFPSEQATLLTHQVEKAERKLLSQSLPYSLEDRLAEDIDELHFAHRWLNEGEVAVAVVRKALMDDWQQEPAISPVGQWVPDTLLLPVSSNQWVVVVEASRCLVRVSNERAFVCQPDLLSVFLSASLESGAPDSIVVYSPSESELPDLDTTLKDLMLVRKGGWLDAVMMSSEVPALLNLRQGSYAPILPWASWWQQWRWVAATLLGAALIHGALSYSQFQQAQSVNLDIRRDIETRYREVYPQGAIVDAEKQLERQLRSLRGDAQSAGFMSLLEQAGVVLNAVPGTQLINLNYTDRNGQLGLTLMASDFDALETLRSKLASAGLKVELENSNAQGDQVRARLRVGGQQ
ncbi:type II secretion system protein GspL [Aequoribacter sp.]|uniref:type II secretion system protein GspL n=1 Tax=Aequoribacter sp. TaxID=2847771 RepID=UPI003C69E7CE